MPASRTVVEIAAIFAAGFLRLLQKRHNSQEQAKLQPPDSVESPCYVPPPEA